MVNTEIRLIIFFAAKDGEALYSQQKQGPRPGADCGSDHEHLIAKFRLKLKKIGKTTRPFRYDLKQTSYDYTVLQSMSLQRVGHELVPEKQQQIFPLDFPVAQW